jgi:hypothetical protein
MQELEVANLLIRNPANTFRYDIVPGAISGADKTLNLPVITTTDTLPAIGLVQTWTADQTFADSVNITLGTGGDADLDYDGTDVVLDTAVVGTGQLHIRTNDNRTATLDTVLTLRSITSATPANGIGTAMGFEADSNNSGEGNMPVGTLAFGVTDMTNTAEDTEFVVHLRVAGAALEEKYNFRSTAGAGYTGIFTHAASADRTWTLPNASDTLIGKATTDTLTNKTFNANGTGNALSNVDIADLANGTDGELITWNASAAPATVAVGSTGHVLTSNGTGAAPTFQAEVASIQMVIVDFTADVATGNGKFYFHVDSHLAGRNINTVHAEVITAGTTNTLDIQINNVTSGADILSTVLTVDSGETGSDTAATAAVINASEDDLTLNDLIRVDVDAVHSTPAKGLLLTITTVLP